LIKAIHLMIKKKYLKKNIQNLVKNQNFQKKIEVPKASLISFIKTNLDQDDLIN